MFIGPEEFEDRWNKLMEEFNLVNHKWLSKMYHLRSSWIPAFFVDSSLCGLMRTTSCSESENLFLSYFTSSGSTLVKFMLCYESAMTHILCIQELKSFLYSRSVYIEALDQGFDPTCFEEQKNRYGEKNKAIKKLAMEPSIILNLCVHMLRNNEPKLYVFINKMKAIKSELEAELPIVLTRIVFYFVQEFIGVKKPDKVKVKNPTCVRPKGREKQKCIKSGREISMKKIVAHGGSDHVDVGIQDGAYRSVSV
nr:protein FAR1-related sequence 5-like [Tanacetum cinerariifolium]